MAGGGAPRPTPPPPSAGAGAGPGRRAPTESAAPRVFGAFASLGVGAVFAAEGEPRLSPERPYRALALSSGASDAPRTVPCGSTSLVFEVQSGPSTGSPRGTRTPLFEIRYKDALYSWYTRLAEPGPVDHDLAGVVRLETMASAGIEAAARLGGPPAGGPPRVGPCPHR